MTGFDGAVSIVRVAEDAFEWTVPEGWQQGRGAWGGLVMGALVDAACAVQPDAIRTVSAQLTAPVTPGAHRIRIEAVRRGRSLVTWRAHVAAGSGEIVASMVLTAGRPRSSAEESDSWGTDCGPDLPDPDAVPVLPVGPPEGPVFMQHCEFRPAFGVPLSGGPARTAGWVRLVEPPRARAGWLVALVDAWWPASLAAMTRFDPVATVCFAANLLVDPSTLRSDAPLAYQARVSGCADGFASEHRTLWTSDGRLAVDNLQTVVVG